MTSQTPATASSPSAPGPERSGSFQLDVERRSVAQALRGYTDRVRSGDPGALPSVLGVVVLLLVFSQVSDRFLSRNNIGNLPGQGAYIAVIALGLVFVLLIGEIDLSAGTTGGIAGGFAAQAVFSGGLHHGVPTAMYWMVLGAMAASAGLGVWLGLRTGPVVVLVGIVIVLTGLDKHVVPAIILAISVGTAVGMFTGWLVAKVGIPSFIVTLALFLAWQGVLLFTLGSQPINVSRYGFWNGLANFNMSPFWSWMFVILVAGGYLLVTMIRGAAQPGEGALRRRHLTRPWSAAACSPRSARS